MKVQLCWRSKDMDKNKRRAGPTVTVREAMAQWKEMNKENISLAYLRKWDGWGYIVDRILKDSE